MLMKLQPFAAKTGDITVNALWGNTTHEKLKMMENSRKIHNLGKHRYVEFDDFRVNRAPQGAKNVYETAAV